MSEKKKRGVSKCKKKLSNPDQSKVDFNEKGIAIDKNAGNFMSWIGVKCKRKIPYDKRARKVNPKKYEDIWEYAKKISETAKKCVKENINPACVGRCGFVGLEPHIESRWNQLVSSFPHLDAIEHPSSIRNTVSKARLNPVTKLYELRENLISNGDLTGLLELLVSIYIIIV
uniref:Uncharacterized protein n=1 Tax=Helianthus annuus TaxID=4232 RepID=A0A251TJT1_HELAN